MLLGDGCSHEMGVGGQDSMQGRRQHSHTKRCGKPHMNAAAARGGLSALCILLFQQFGHRPEVDFHRLRRSRLRLTQVLCRRFKINHHHTTITPPLNHT